MSFLVRRRTVRRKISKGAQVVLHQTRGRAGAKQKKRRLGLNRAINAIERFGGQLVITGLLPLRRSGAAINDPLFANLSLAKLVSYAS